MTPIDDPPLRRASDADDQRIDQRIERVAHVAARNAADIVSVAAVAAAQVASTAANAAHALAQTAQIDLGYIKRDLEEIKSRLDSKFVSVEAFDPIRRLVHGMVALILIGVVGGLLALVIRQ